MMQMRKLGNSGLEIAPLMFGGRAPDFTNFTADGNILNLRK